MRNTLTAQQKRFWLALRDDPARRNQLRDIDRLLRWGLIDRDQWQELMEDEDVSRVSHRIDDILARGTWDG